MSLCPGVSLRTALLAVAATAAFATSAWAGSVGRPVVVELYTSQGCSSCPPADAFLRQLAKRNDVLALSLPITYWDMLGWTDTLASRANTDRQKAYAAVMGRGGVYTPQMIIDGIDDVVGSRVKAVDRAISKREADMPDVPVTLKLTRNEVHVRIAAAKGNIKRDATIWLFRIRPQATVKIGGGENNGRTITYRNVVRAVKAVGIWKGRAVSLDLPRQAMGGHADDGVAVVVQSRGYGRILGATPIDTMNVATANH